MQTVSRIPFTTVKTEGGILPADLLSRVAAGSVEGLRPEDYHLAPSERLNEAISRSWNRLLGVWRSFDDQRRALPESDRGTSLTRERWLLILFQELGYGRLPFAGKLTVEDGHGDSQAYPISHAWQHAPIHLVSFRQEMDRRDPAVGRSPHSLLQEFLNRWDASLWGFASNGLRLRVLRDNASLTRAAYVEFDLEAMMAGELYSDFSLLWLICHQSRVERRAESGERPEDEAAPLPAARSSLAADCWLERWSHTAAEQGARALDALRDGVEEAIAALGKGFLGHKANQRLRGDLQAGRLSAYSYYRELLRLVYRLIFLFVAEDRNLLLLPDATAQARERYRSYSLGRLRDLAEARRGSPHPDLYRGLRLLFAQLRSGYAPLGLPGLGGFLFSERSTPHLDDADIANRELLDALRALAFAVDNGVRRPVDYRNLDAEELGSVYESLLELHPQLNVDAATFALEVVAGSERKTTGTHYTPTPLVNSLLDTALEPVVAERLDSVKRENVKREEEASRFTLHVSRQEQAILSIKVLDYACGSGHMLIGAGRRLARHLARIRTGDEEPAPEAMRAAMRDVVRHCLMGVDINEMAVELCKVALWMESLEPGKPLSFLDKNIQCGNSLLGATPAALTQGIPDAAFTPLQGDDKTYCQEWKRRNKAQRAGQLSLFSHDLQPWERLGALATAMAQMDAAGDDTLAGVQRQEALYEQLVRSSDYRYGRLLADAWCASFVWRKTRDYAYPITEEVFRRIERNPFDVAPWMVEEISRLAAQYQFLHWHLAFPQVFRPAASSANPWGLEGGFDVVLSNPPWEHTELKEKEFFATHRLDIVHAPTGAERKRLIDDLAVEDPSLFQAFIDASREHDAVSAFVRTCEQFPLCGRGRINTYAVFAEMARLLLSPAGQAGVIVPSGIATDDTTKYFFQDIMETGTLASLYDLENRRAIFTAVHRSFKFCLLTLRGKTLTPGPSPKGRGEAEGGAQFVFFALDVADLRDPERRFTLSAADIALLNPNTRTCPIFRSKRDAELTKSIYRRVPVLIKEGPPEENPWGVKFLRMLDMSNDSHLFRTREQSEAEGWRLVGNRFLRGGEVSLPLYEGRMLDHFDHRAAAVGVNPDTPFRSGTTIETSANEHDDPRFLAMPRYWVSPEDVDLRIPNDYQWGWFAGFKDISSATNQRTFIGSIIPRTAVGNKIPLLLSSLATELWACVIAGSSAYVFDYVARQKMGNVTLNFFIVKQLPFLTAGTFTQPCPWADHVSSSITHNAWLLPRVLELTYTAWDLLPFAQDVLPALGDHPYALRFTDHVPPPFRWDEERRFLLRCELDAAYFHLYGIERDDVDYILETFPIVKRKDVAAHGEYRTKRVILEIYDAMQQAMDSGQPYQTRLDPPPADPSVAHTSPPPEWVEAPSLCPRS
jgi:hypothetical protein